ncbi:MAG TPA: hypothetical protein VF754_07980 [Pyrinomonadaceae bacterium]
MTTKRRPQGGAQSKSELAEPTTAQQNVALLLSGVLNDPDTPRKLAHHIHLGLDALHEDLDSADKLRDTPEYIALLLAEHAAQTGGER